MKNPWVPVIIWALSFVLSLGLGLVSGIFALVGKLGLVLLELRGESPEAPSTASLISIYLMVFLLWLVTRSLLKVPLARKIILPSGLLWGVYVFGATLSSDFGLGVPGTVVFSVIIGLVATWPWWWRRSYNSVITMIREAAK